MNCTERLQEACRDHRRRIAEARFAEARRDDLIRLARREGQLSTKEIVLATELSYARVASIVAGDPDRRARVTLHAAMQQVLRETGGRWMRVDEIAREVYERELYQRKDRGVIPPGQIRSRAARYPDLFEGSTDGSNSVRLRSSAA